MSSSRFVKVPGETELTLEDEFFFSTTHPSGMSEEARSRVKNIAYKTGFVWEPKDGLYFLDEDFDEFKE